MQEIAGVSELQGDQASVQPRTYEAVNGPPY